MYVSMYVCFYQLYMYIIQYVRTNGSLGLRKQDLPGSSTISLTTASGSGFRVARWCEQSRRWEICSLDLPQELKLGGAMAQSSLLDYPYTMLRKTGTKTVELALKQSFCQAWQTCAAALCQDCNGRGSDLILSWSCTCPGGHIEVWACTVQSSAQEAVFARDESLTLPGSKVDRKVVGLVVHENLRASRRPEPTLNPTPKPKPQARGPCTLRLRYQLCHLHRG